MRKLNYTKCGIICHGLSEVQIAKYIKTNLHLKIQIFSKDKGNSSVQITSINNFLKKIFKNMAKFCEDYDIEYDGNKPINFKLFIIMDTDDCSEEIKNSFISKKIFEKHPLCDFIYPIYNINNLEDVLLKSGIMPKRIKSNEKGSYYVRTFPINDEPFSLDSFKEILDFKNKLSPIKETNLDCFIEYCLDLALEQNAGI